MKTPIWTSSVFKFGESAREVHVYPENEEHLMQEVCRCFPVVEHVDNGVIMRHRSFETDKAVIEAQSIIGDWA